jgi:hypothetical protein
MISIAAKMRPKVSAQCNRRNFTIPFKLGHYLCFVRFEILPGIWELGFGTSLSGRLFLDKNDQYSEGAKQPADDSTFIFLEKTKVEFLEVT